MIFKCADDRALFGVFADGSGIKGLDPSRIDQGDAVSLAFESFFGLQGYFHHGSQGNEADIGAFLNHLSLADCEEFRLVLNGGAGAVSAWVADGDGAVLIVGHGPEHVDELIFIFGLHVNDPRHVAKVADVEESVVSRAIVSGESTPVHAKADGEALQSHVMNDHVVSPLHESRVDREEGAEAFRGVTTGKEGGVFFRDSGVEVSFWNFLLKGFQFGSAGHGGGNGGDPLVFFGEVRDGAAEEFREGGGTGRGGAIINVVGPEAVEFAGLVEGRLVSATFFGDDMQDDRFVFLLEVLEGLDEGGEIVPVDRPVITKAKFLKENVRHDHIFGVAFDLVGKFTRTGAGHFFDEICSLGPDSVVGGVGLKGVEIFGESSNILINGPLVVIENDDAPFSGDRDVVEGFKGRAAGEGCVASYRDDVVVGAFDVAGRAHSEGR